MQQHFIHNASGTRLCLHQIEPIGPVAGCVILAHGFFSNHRSCRGLAKYLAGLNYECWLLDFQGHGFSCIPESEPDFETMCLQDTAAVLAFIKERSDKPVWWIGHSGGGLAILMYLARYSSQQSELAGIVTLASQATDAGLRLDRKVLFKLAGAAVSILGYAPGKILRLGSENEFKRVMQQWFYWSCSGAWLGADGFDYTNQLSAVVLPSLSIAGSADRLIAPASGCQKIVENLGGQNKKFLLCGKYTGYLEDYSHARLISSRNASADVWPAVGRWLKDPGSPIDKPGE